MLVRGLLVAGGLVGIVVLVSGCGGSRAPSVANVATTSSPATQTTVSTPTGSPASREAGITALASCLNDHGLTATVGSAGTAPNNVVSIGGVIVSGSSPGTPAFQAAMQACRKYLPGGGPPAMSPSQKAEWAKAMTSFAACMRKNGVTSFPDPTGAGTFPAGFLGRLDPGSAQFQSAVKACEPLEPGFGPRFG
jgi:hypothetical protein